MITATALQSGMLFHSIAHPGTGVDIEQVSMRLDEALDPDRFMAAWRQVTERHPILRSRFVWADVAEPQLEVVPPTEIDLPVVTEDWSAAPSASHDELIARCLRADRLTDFDLAQGPLQRFVIADLGHDRWWVLWSFHHAALDGRSFPLVLSEVFDLYDQGLDHPLAPRPDFDHYVDVVAGQDLTQARSYWTKRLEPVEAPSSITVERAGPPPGHGPAVLPVERPIGVERTNALRRLAAQEEVSLNTCVQAAWYLLLRHYSPQPVVTFGTTRACRHAVPDAADMIGLLINTVPMTVANDDEETVGALLRRLRHEQIELRAHETTPLPVIRQCAPAAVTDLFESIVVFDDASLDARMSAAFPATAATRRFRYDGQTNFPLTLLAYGDESMLLRLEGAVDRYDEATIERLLDQLVNVLDGFAAAPDQGGPHGAVPHRGRGGDLRGVERHERRLRPRHHPPRPVRGPGGPHPRRPGPGHGRSPAHLRPVQRGGEPAGPPPAGGQGVGTDTGVGIFAERSFEMMIGIYAALKAGGAYVPLDPEHPAERIRFMAEDSAVPVILAQAHLADALPAGPYQVITLDGADGLAGPHRPHRLGWPRCSVGDRAGHQPRASPHRG